MGHLSHLLQFLEACGIPNLSRLGTHYLCGSSERLDDGLELEVIDKEEEMGDGEASKAEDDGGEVG
jgi:hypothetical protein